MARENATAIKDTALQAGWSERGARWMAVRVQEPTAAAQVVAAAVKVPDAVRAMILKDKRHTSDAALIAAFKEAAEIAEMLNHCAHTAPLALRNIGNYVHRSSEGEHLMTAAEARKKLATALAEMDVHIDTTRPLAASERGAIGSIAQVAEAHWAAKKGT
jgi:hypothetical protein